MKYMSEYMLRKYMSGNNRKGECQLWIMLCILGILSFFLSLSSVWGLLLGVPG